MTSAIKAMNPTPPLPLTLTDYLEQFKWIMLLRCQTPFKHMKAPCSTTKECLMFPLFQTLVGEVNLCY